MCVILSLLLNLMSALQEKMIEKINTHVICHHAFYKGNKVIKLVGRRAKH